MKLLALGIALVVLFLAAAVYEEMQWQDFSKAHECVLVSKSTGTSVPGVGFGANGNTTITSSYIPGKDGYKCNDGITYYR